MNTTFDKRLKALEAQTDPFTNCIPVKIGDELLLSSSKGLKSATAAQAAEVDKSKTIPLRLHLKPLPLPGAIGATA